jgi:hypothetical protein
MQILQPMLLKMVYNIDVTKTFKHHSCPLDITGTGKSWIAMYILLEFYKKYPKLNVLWICERKDILIQQFSKNSRLELKNHLRNHKYKVENDGSI